MDFYAGAIRTGPHKPAYAPIDRCCDDRHMSPWGIVEVSQRHTLRIVLSESSQGCLPPCSLMLYYARCGGDSCLILGAAFHGSSAYILASSGDSRAGIL